LETEKLENFVVSNHLIETDEKGGGKKGGTEGERRQPGCKE